MPPRLETEDGTPRRVGLELEYAGTGIDESCRIVADLFDGRVTGDNPFSRQIEGTAFGDFTVEIDASLLKDRKYRTYLQQAGIDIDDADLRESIESILKRVAQTVVPCEVVTPPIPLRELAVVEKLVERLRESRARGTRSSVLYAFGLHMNPEIASSKPAYLLNHIRAAALLHDWIVENSGVDLSRRLTPYIDPYPAEFVDHIVDGAYAPDLAGLIGDYLRFVPSRNHALDMLPCFAHLDESRVMAAAREPELVKPRPAFHYRLANCVVDDPQWTVAGEWRYWVRIEEIAGDPAALARLSGAWCEHRRSLLPTRGAWAERAAAILES